MIERGKRRALVTGATGFVGSRVVRRLVAEGWDVHVIARQSSSLGQLDPVRSSLKVSRIVEDRDLRGIVRDGDPDVVFHFASRFIAEHEPEQISDLIDSNVRFGTHLVEAMALNDKRLLVNVGTSWQHFETSTYRPVCLYAATKQAFDAIVDFYIDARDLRVITMMLSDTYGPGDPRQKLFTAFRKASGAGAPIPFSAGDQMIDLVYIDDVVDAFLIAAERLLAGECRGKEEFAVSSMAPCSLREVAAAYAAVLGTTLNIDWGARPYRKREVMRPWQDGLPIPGWRPIVPLSEGILRTEGLHE
jgi:nucleoside-diphosphate-sugar epimerase